MAWNSKPLYLIKLERILINLSKRVDAVQATGGSVAETIFIIANKTIDLIKNRLKDGRVDFVGLGDSNQLFGGHGWDSGFQETLSETSNMYATGLISVNENGANGIGRGYGYAFNAARGLIGTSTGAPTFLDNKLDNNGGNALSSLEYSYLSTGTFQSSSTGLIADADFPFNPATDDLRLHLNYGTFDTGSGGFRLSIRLGQSPWTQYQESATFNTNTGAESMQIATLDLPSGTVADNTPLNFRITSNSTSITAPYFSTFMRIESIDKTTGFSYHTMHGVGGNSLRDMANDLQVANIETLTHYFEEVRRLQSGLKTVVLTINSGLNDRNEASTSVGGSAILDGDSAEAYKDNLKAIKDVIDNVWSVNGWDYNSLFYLVIPSHPISFPYDTEILSYRNAAKDFANEGKNIAVIDLSELTSEEELSEKGFYNSSGTDKNHLTNSGYKELSKRILREIGIE